MSQELTTLTQEILEIIPQMMRILAAEFRRTGQLMTPGNLQLMLLLQGGPASLSELAEVQNVSLPTMSRSISRLEKIGWINRLSDPRDRRVALIVMTDDGCRRLREMSDTAQKVLGNALQSTSLAERETLSDGLAVLRRAFELNNMENKERC